jgi:hypothetical protein
MLSLLAGKRGSGEPSFACNQDGQAILEYILLLAISLGLVLTLYNGIIITLDKGILAFGGKLERSLRTGRASIDVYTD